MVWAEVTPSRRTVPAVEAKGSECPAGYFDRSARVVFMKLSLKMPTLVVDDSE